MRSGRAELGVHVGKRAEAEASLVAPLQGVLSKFAYRNSCTGEEVAVYIEPLVGHFR